MSENKIIQQDLHSIVKTNLDWSRFKNTTVLISGANGFLPAYMVEVLLFLNSVIPEININVIALVRNIDKAKLRFISHLHNKHLSFLVQDVCDKIVTDSKIDYIIHAASQASPKYYSIDPVGTLSANIIGTINLLELALKNKCESFLYFSSAEVYGSLPDETKLIDESNFGYLNPTTLRSCYAESKRMGENICVSYFNQYEVNAKIVRPFHTYGPKMALDDGRVYADFVSDIVASRDIVMKSNGLPRRAFCYLSEATTAFFLVLLNGKNGEAYNVGNPEAECSIKELAQALVEMFKDRKINLVQAENMNTNYMSSKVSRIIPNIEKIKELGWYPKINIEEGFYKTILSYKNDVNNESI